MTATLLATSANAQPASGQHRRDAAGGHGPWALVVLDVRGDGIAGISSFLDTPAVFAAFALPDRLP